MPWVTEEEIFKRSIQILYLCSGISRSACGCGDRDNIAFMLGFCRKRVGCAGAFGRWQDSSRKNFGRLADFTVKSWKPDGRTGFYEEK